MSSDRDVTNAGSGSPTEAITGRQFNQVRRGYDPSEVRRFQAELADEVQRLRDRGADLAERLARAEANVARPIVSEEDVVAAVGDEMATILRSAHGAASDLRARAAEEANTLVTEARSHAEVVRSEADEHRARAEAESEGRLSSARSHAETLVARAVAEAEGILEAARHNAAAEAAQVIAKSRADGESYRQQAEQDRRLTIEGAQAIRERILSDLARRRRVATVQIEQLRAGRERLLESYGVVRRTLEEVHDELQRADAEARAAADEAGRRLEAETVEPTPAAVGPVASVPVAHGPVADGPVADGPVDAGAGEDAPTSDDADRSVEGIGEGAPGAFGAADPGAVGAGSGGDPGASSGSPTDHDKVQVQPAPPTVNASISAPTSEAPDAVPTAEAGIGGVPTGGAATGGSPTIGSPTLGAPTAGIQTGMASESATGRDRVRLVRVGRMQSVSAPTVGSALPPTSAGGGRLRVVSGAAAALAVDTAEDAAPTASTATLELVGDDDREPADAVGTLFDRIRAGRERSVAEARRVLGGAGPAGAGPAGSSPSPSPSPSTVEAEPAGEVGSEDEEDPERSEGTRPGEVRSDADESELQLRDAQLEEVLSGLTRRLKRALQDEHNDLLDRLRGVRGIPTLASTLGDQGDQVARYAGAAELFVRQAAMAGAVHTAGPVDEWAEGVVDAVTAKATASVATAIVEPIRRRVEALLAERGGDAGEVLVDALASVYRETRSHRIEPLAVDTVTAVHAEAGWTVAPEGTAFRWIAEDAGGPCPDCDDNVLAGSVTKGEEFPTGQLYPPAHQGCHCLLVADPA